MNDHERTVKEFRDDELLPQRELCEYFMGSCREKIQDKIGYPGKEGLIENFNWWQERMGVINTELLRRGLPVK